MHYIVTVQEFIYTLVFTRISGSDTFSVYTGSRDGAHFMIVWYGEVGCGREGGDVRKSRDITEGSWHCLVSVSGVEFYGVMRSLLSDRSIDADGVVVMGVGKVWCDVGSRLGEVITDCMVDTHSGLKLHRSLESRRIVEQDSSCVWDVEFCMGLSGIHDVLGECACKESLCSLNGNTVDSLCGQQESERQHVEESVGSWYWGGVILGGESWGDCVSGGGVLKGEGVSCPSQVVISVEVCHYLYFCSLLRLYLGGIPAEGSLQEAWPVQLLEKATKVSRVALTPTRDRPPLLPIPAPLLAAADKPDADTPPRRDYYLLTPRPGQGLDYQVRVVHCLSSELRLKVPVSSTVRALEARVTVLETDARRHEWQRQAADDLAVQYIMRTQALEAGARVDTLEDTGSSS
ncbi:hypothetical protein Tco_0729186 [Tanacetum coccineum]|uniref:Uncharacterized protein n=1 Tax=Tanacetum coccineum TaxID=301880 RepID=A0ABQ4YNP4_9ASTR